MDEIKERLRAIIVQKSLSFGKFVLSSGKESSYYLDCRKAALHPEGLYCISRLFLDKVRKSGKRVDAVGGLTIGADPLVAGVVALSHIEGYPLEGFIVRKETKKHGTGRQIEGNLEGGSSVVIVDDVVTTGSSILRAVEEVEAMGCNVALILAVVDREEGGGEMFRKKYDYSPIFSIDEILKGL